MSLHPKTQEFIELLENMKEIALAKSSDYAGSEDPMSNFRLSQIAGIPAWKGIFVRMGDKFSRIANFVKQGELKVKDESIEDTLLDLANYSLLCLIMYREAKSSVVTTNGSNKVVQIPLAVIKKDEFSHQPKE